MYATRVKLDDRYLEGNVYVLIICLIYTRLL